MIAKQHSTVQPHLSWPMRLLPALVIMQAFKCAVLLPGVLAAYSSNPLRWLPLLRAVFLPQLRSTAASPVVVEVFNNSIQLGASPVLAAGPALAHQAAACVGHHCTHVCKVHVHQARHLHSRRQHQQRCRIARIGQRLMWLVPLQTCFAVASAAVSCFDSACCLGCSTCPSAPVQLTLQGFTNKDSNITGSPAVTA
jgi:hypothetical protein